jgi:hypothetical protein
MTAFLSRYPLVRVQLHLSNRCVDLINERSVPLTLIPNDWIRDQEVFSVNGNGPFVGAGFTNGADLLDVSSPLFANYDLRTSIGPITGKGTVPGFGSVPSPTSGGDLVLNSVGDVTFIARTAP